MFWTIVVPDLLHGHLALIPLSDPLLTDFFLLPMRMEMRSDLYADETAEKSSVHNNIILDQTFDNIKYL